MRTPGLFTKLAVLLFFIALLSGFVAYRSGLLPDPFSSSSAFDSDSTRRTTLTKAEYDSLLMLQPDSMKGQGIRDASGRRVYFMDDDTTAYTILPGSKSLTPVFDLNETPEPATRTYLPTSKSLGGTPPIKFTPDSTK